MIRVRTLGECVIEVGEHGVGSDSAVLFGFLLYLALERGKRLPRPALVELFWPGLGAERGRHCLRQTLYKLRQLGVTVRSSAADVLLCAEQVRVDFLDLAAGAPIDVPRLREGGAAVGDVLPGYAPELSPAFADWLEQQRDYARAVVRRALSTALAECRARQRWADVDVVARQCLRLDPLNEEATLALAEATALTGSKARALEILDRYVAELGAGAGDIALPATILRRRIAERLPSRRYSTAADAVFVGREASVELLAGLLREARAGIGGACLVWGAAGIGKSRLVAECTRAAALQGARIARVALQASDARRPLAAFVDLVPVLQTLPGALGVSPTSVRYLKRLTEHDASATAPSEDARDAEFLFACVRQSLFDLVDAVASEGTLVVVVEDVHWLDQVSWEVLREMIDWAASRRLLFLLTSRDEHPSGAPERAPTLRLLRHHLGALDERASAALLDALTREGGREIGDELRAWCIAVAEGNPFFLNELARQWVETGDATRPPASLLGVLGDRMSRLHPRSLRVLQACAVLGRNATLEHVEAVTEYPRHELLDSLEELEGVNLLTMFESALLPRHALIVEHALNRLPECAARLLHRGAALALAREIESARSATRLWDCARHWRLAGESGRVHALVLSCATHLMEMGLPRESAEIYRTALELSDTVEARYELLRGLATALIAASLWKQAKDVIQDLMRQRTVVQPLASDHSDEELDLLETDWRLEQPIPGLLARALACVEDVSSDPGHRLRAACSALRLADNIVDRDTAHHVYAISSSLVASRGEARTYRTMCDLIYHSSYGDLERASQAADELLDQERNHGTTADLVRALRYDCVPKMRLGNLQAALASAHEAFRIAQERNMSGLAVGAADDIAALYLESGHLDSAMRWCRVARSGIAEIEDRYKIQETTHTYLRALVLCGDRAAARREFPYSVEGISQIPSLRSRTAWLALAADLSTTSDARQSAQRIAEHLTQAHTQTRASGGQDANTASLVELLLALGEREKATTLLAAYLENFRRDRGELPFYLQLTALKLRDAG